MRAVLLGEVISLEYGKSLPENSRAIGDVPVYGSNGQTGWHNRPLINGPSVIVGRKGSIGQVHYHPGPAFPIDTTYYVKPRPGVDVDLKFVFFMLKELNLTRLNSATGVPGLNREQAYKIATRLPPIDEQCRIVSLLDRAANIRRRADAARAKARAIIPALFLDMFGDPMANPRGWDVAKLGNLLDRIDGGWSPVCGDGAPTIDEWGVLKLSAVKSTGFVGTEAKRLPETLEPRENLEVHEGDLLFTRKNTIDLVGAAAVVNSGGRRRMLPDTIFRLVPKSIPDFVPPYVSALINLPAFRPAIRQLASGSASSMPGISKGRLSELKIPVPDLPFQTEFAKQSQRIEATTGALEDAAIKSAAMAAVLSAELFT